MLRPAIVALALVLVAPMPFFASPSEAAASALSFTATLAPDAWSEAHHAGETSIGVDPATGAVLFLIDLQTARVDFDDAGQPTWRDVSGTATGTTTTDPILFVDPSTHRTFEAQLAGPSSLFAFSDDDGASWTSASPPFTGSFDHETVGGGPFPVGATHLGSSYRDATYYCAQGGAVAQCARSDDGGLTWGAPVVFNTGECESTHGHVVVAPDGTVYVPDRYCGGVNGVFVSRDAGLTWTMHKVPGTIPTNGDPAIAVDAGGRVYLIGAGASNHAVVATSTDRGASWSAPLDVGASLGIENAEFHMATAGDAGRATVAFYGSTTAGDDQDGCGCEITGVNPPFTGDWHVIVAQTLDGGATWTSVDATPNDNMQHGCIWLGGGANRCRNLLDFQGMTVDPQGRVLIGYADGCTPQKCLNMHPEAYAPTQDDFGDSWGGVLRQTSGARMFAAYDPPGGVDPLVVSAGGPYATRAGEPVQVTARATGGVAPYSFAWDLDGDGAYDDAAGSTATFRAAAGGDFNIRVRVTDAGRAVSVAVATVHVVDALVANAGGPYATDAGTAVTVTATAAGGVQPYAFAWDLDGDGLFDDASGANATFTPVTSGNFTLAVLVTDAEGWIRVAHAALAVDTAPLASWSFDSDGCTGTQGWSSRSDLIGTGLDTTAAFAWRLTDQRSLANAPVSSSDWMAASGLHGCWWRLAHENDFEGAYPPNLHVELASPGGSGCLDLPAGTTSARVAFRVIGTPPPSASPYKLVARSCVDGHERLIATLTEDHSEVGTVVASLRPVVGTGPFQIVLEQDMTNLLGWTFAYQIDDVVVRAG